MNHELELKLYNKYPKILQDCGKSPMESCMSFWMECGDGWFKLLDECFEKIQYFSDLCSKDDREVNVVTNQIKEKFGSLVIYITCHGANKIESDIIHGIIDQTEIISTQTCEETGAYGSLCIKNGWYKTLCYEKSRELGFKACSESTESYWKEKDKVKCSD